MQAHFSGEGCSPDCEAVLQDVPVADAKPEEIKELLGGALFKALYKWMIDSGPVYLLPTGGALQALLPIVTCAGCMAQLEKHSHATRWWHQSNDLLYLR